MALPDYQSLPAELFTATTPLEASLMGQGNYGRAAQSRQQRRQALPQVRDSVTNVNDLLTQAFQTEQTNDLYKTNLGAYADLQDVLAQAGPLAVNTIMGGPGSEAQVASQVYDSDLQGVLDAARVQEQVLAATPDAGSTTDAYTALEGVKATISAGIAGNDTVIDDVGEYLRGGGDPMLLSDGPLRQAAIAARERAQGIAAPQAGASQTGGTQSTPFNPDLATQTLGPDGTNQLLRLMDEGVIVPDGQGGLTVVGRGNP